MHVRTKFGIWTGRKERIWTGKERRKIFVQYQFFEVIIIHECILSEARSKERNRETETLIHRSRDSRRERNGHSEHGTGESFGWVGTSVAGERMAKGKRCWCEWL
jgi:hypothetical protein